MENFYYGDEVKLSFFEGECDLGWVCGSVVWCYKFMFNGILFYIFVKWGIDISWYMDM